VYAIFTFGLRPKTIPVIKPSNFENFGAIGATAAKLLWPRLSQYSNVVFLFENRDFGSEQIYLAFQVELKSRELESQPSFSQIPLVNELSSLSSGQLNVYVVNLQTYLIAADAAERCDQLPLLALKQIDCSVIVQRSKIENSTKVNHGELAATMEQKSKDEFVIYYLK